MTPLSPRFFRFLLILLCALLSGCAQVITVSYPSQAVIHPVFDQPFATWQGERVQIELTPSLRGDSLKYLANYDRVVLANSIRQFGLRHDYKVAGIGTPLVVHSRNPKLTPKEQHYPSSGITLGITAVKEERPGQMPVLKVYDAFDPAVVRTSYGSHPIAADYTATLATLLAHAKRVANSSIGSFIRPDDPTFATGIYLIQPYDPNKIPILFVHGLAGTPLSWQNLTNELCSNPEILEHYQPWFFLYPTGQPVLQSAAQLREALQTTQKIFDPTGTAIPSHHVVVIAHSMGGLLSHTLVSDSGDALWNTLANKPFQAVSLSPSTRLLVSKLLFFRHQHCIDRVIFLSVPHRGSALAAGVLGGIGNRLIKSPQALADALRESAAQNPGVLTPYFARVMAAGGPTSLFSLAPNPLLNALADLPILVPFHSIIGDRGLDGGTRSSDGLVAYSSSHLEGAESEKIVHAGHYLFSNPVTVAEIERILDENLAGSHSSMRQYLAHRKPR